MIVVYMRTFVNVSLRMTMRVFLYTKEQAELYSQSHIVQ